MLLKIYKTNQPFILGLLPLIAFLLWFPSFRTPSSLEIEKTTYIFNLFVSASTFFNHVFAILLILVSAVLLDDIINKNDFFHKNIYLTSFLYVLITSSVPSLNTLHPILFSNLFVILAFRRLINIHSQVSCKSEVFDATLFFLAAGAFYPPSLLLIPFSWFALIIFRPFKLNEWLVPFLALGIFLIYYFSSLLFLDNVPLFDLSSLIQYSIYVNKAHSFFFYSIAFLSSLSFLLGIYHIHRRRSRSTIRFKKMTNSISTFFVWGLILFVLVYSLTGTFEFLYLLSVPFMISLSYFFIYFKKQLVAELILTALTILVVLNNYF